MTVLDPTTTIGKMRLRCGDFSDLPIMPDEVYQSALSDCSGNVPQASKLVCQYILATLTGQTRQKLAQVEVFGGEWYSQYRDYLKLTINNPNFMLEVPAPYGYAERFKLREFQTDWNKLYGVTEATQNHYLAQAIGCTEEVCNQTQSYGLWGI